MPSDVENKLTAFFQTSLKKGEKRKILYLYDEEKNYTEELDTWRNKEAFFQLVEVNEFNYFYTKYQIETKNIDQSFFLYLPIKRPPDQENPILDILLYSEELKLDKETQFYTSIGIDQADEELISIAKEYTNFFKAKERTLKFNRLFQMAMTRNKDSFEYSILATLVKADQPYWIEIMVLLFDEAAKKEQAKWETVRKFGNVQRFWQLMDRLFGYNESTSVSKELTIQSLMQQVFMTHLSVEFGIELPKQLISYVLPKTNHVVIFMNQWMNLKNQQAAYISVADIIEKELAIAEIFENTEIKAISQAETFSWFDEQLIQQVMDQLTSGGIDYEYYESLIAKRRNEFWYSDYRTAYHLLQWSIQIFKQIQLSEIELPQLTNPLELWQAYETTLYKIDQAYRKFYYYFDLLEDRQDSFESLKNQVENEYKFSFMQRFADSWDKQLTREPNFRKKSTQQNFYEKEVLPFVQKEKRVFVIISDGLRFEAGKELFDQLINEKRYTGEIKQLQTAIPSNTALGMAALLPHQQLEVLPTGEVLVDGMPASNLEKRAAILKLNGHPDAMATSSDEINQMNRSELRKIFSGKKVIYIYHNHIDAIGDQRITENNVFNAVDETIQQLKKLMDRLTLEISASQLIVTADHGFLYNRSPIQLTEKVSLEQNSNFFLSNKRFVLSKEQLTHSSGISFPLSSQTNAVGNIMVPRGINRFAMSGGGYQYVHGGHMPQEIMIPLLRIKTERGRNEMPQVSIKLVSQTRTITNSIIWLDFLQLEAVSDQLKEKQMNLYFEDDQGKKISNEITLIADSENSVSQDRVNREKFVLLNQNYNRNTHYYLVMVNVKDEMDIQKETFTIDIVEEID